MAGREPTQISRRSIRQTTGRRQRPRAALDSIAHIPGRFGQTPAKCLMLLGCDGGRTRARTWDPMIKSHLLYQLSYAPGTGPESLRKRASFSKAPPRCPASRRNIPRPFQRGAGGKKAAGFRRLFMHFDRPADRAIKAVRDRPGRHGPGRARHPGHNRDPGCDPGPGRGLRRPGRARIHGAASRRRRNRAPCG
jgi:hypothetical protein